MLKIFAALGVFFTLCFVAGISLVIWNEYECWKFRRDFHEEETDWDE